MTARPPSSQLDRWLSGLFAALLGMLPISVGLSHVSPLLTLPTLGAISASGILAMALSSAMQGRIALATEECGQHGSHGASSIGFRL